ncbi:VCBS domain-containing protein, partial [Legionella feeleii]|uniref:VCBS domain-containing protein n=1 Tax=Legionella feeleii TaxID=453 RepID=UPI001B807ADB
MVTANNAQTAIQQLGAGQTLTESFTAASADGTATKLVTVTIQGTNDVPVIAGVSTGTVTEDTALTNGNLTKSGTLTIADVD